MLISFLPRMRLMHRLLSFAVGGLEDFLEVCMFASRLVTAEGRNGQAQVISM
jgi:hypothetical protein